MQYSEKDLVYADLQVGDRVLRVEYTNNGRYEPVPNPEHVITGYNYWWYHHNNKPSPIFTCVATEETADGGYFVMDAT